ncbi:MAG: ABC transporter ATP-binding protein [Chloroflexota bacterium]|nr:MAG: ABC transporter ATP-binding protein [Chloroflexota bacterium]
MAYGEFSVMKDRFEHAGQKTMTQLPVIAAQNLCIDYKLDKQWINAINGVSLAINPFETHGLVGESGSGKSTLALALMRYMAANARIESGEVLFYGENLLVKSDAEMRRIWGRQMSLVPQDPLASLNPAYPIGEQIAEITRLHEGLSRPAARQRAFEVLERVRIADPEAVARKYPHQLSGGMQQRVNIAMALSTQPKLLVLDEPTTALDVTTEAVILDLFRSLIQENRGAALYVSHNLGVIAQMCDRVTVLYAGEVMACAPVDELYANPLHPYTISLLASIPRPLSGHETRLPTIPGVAPSLAERPRGCVFAPRCPVALQQCFDEKPPLEETGPGRLVKCHRWREIAEGTLAVETPHEPMADTSQHPALTGEGYVLNVEGLSKRYGSHTLFSRLNGDKSRFVQAVDNVAMRVRARSTLGLVGESGSGKTTLARCIVGLETADDGRILLLDVIIPNALRRRSRAFLRELQMVFQNPNDTLNPYQTVGQALGRTIRRLKTEPLTPEHIQARVIDLLAAVRLTPDYAGRYPAELSGGEKQRVAIARAFAANPALVVADEPTSALDVSVQAVILNLLKDLRAREGASYLVISHDLAAIAYLADWIAVMYLGQIVEEGSTEQVYNIPSHPYTEALLSAIPAPDPRIKQGNVRLEGEVPSAAHIPRGCRFHTRCPRKIGAICEQEEPPWREAGSGHRIRCHIPIEDLIVLQNSAP